MTITAVDDDVAELRRRLEEAEETLRAIRCGEVDALVVQNVDGERVYTLEGADHAYRALIECMHQGALSLSSDGTILYCNRCFADMLRMPHERVIGTSVCEFLQPAQRPLFESMLAKGCSRSSQGELQFQTAGGKLLSVYVALSPLKLSDVLALCMVVTDLTEQKQHQELQVANRRKDEFLAMLAHELRNPLAPIQNAVSLLRQPGIDGDDLAFAGSVIERQVNQLSHLVDDLLDVSRITLGKIKLQQKVVNLATVLDRAVETSRPIIDSRGQRLTRTFPPHKVQVEVDPTRLAQVIGNLLTNAAKYTDEGGEISLTTEREAEHVVIRVRDNGIGISAELLPHIFELFTQGDRSLARSEGGLGIGLTLVQRLVELHGGTVEAHSDGLGKGSEFIVRLREFVEVEKAFTDPAKASSQPNGKGSLSILVVEDNQDGANVLGMLLRILGHQVRIAFSGLDAIQLANEFNPQVILLDIGLPGISGYEVAKRLRALPKFEKTIFIAMTGYGQDDDRLRSSDAGFDHHLVKPVAPDALNAILESTILGRSKSSPGVHS